MAREEDRFFVPENVVPGSRRESFSPSGKYKLVTEALHTKEGCWSYSQGTLYRAGTDAPIAVVNRNYSSFDCTWLEAHANGHDYFIGGEDYQGQTVVELDTGRRRDHLPAEAEQGVAYCWIEPEYDAKTQTLVVSGCHWACPYEFRFYDFSNPMEGWPEIEADRCVEMDRRQPVFGENGIVTCFQTEYVEDEEPAVCGVERPLPEIAATTFFRREGLKLLFVEEVVTEKEQLVRKKREEGRVKYEAEIADFKKSDPLFLAYLELVKDPELAPEDYQSVGVTHKDWCPHFKGDERRWCRRILGGKRDENGHTVKDQPCTVDLEWATKTGPIKLVIYKGGKHVEDKFFDHSVAEMEKAFTYAKEVARGVH